MLFHSTQGALRAEKVLEGAGMTTKLIPTPRQFSSDCGLALRFPWPEEARVQAILESSGVDFEGVHQLERE